MGSSRFEYFVVLAGMRTGSNLLEEQLSAMPGIVSHGELFNPHFFGKPGNENRFGLSLAARDSNPLHAIAAMLEFSEGLPGFRLFYDHDRRVIDHVLADARAAKIILTRRPIDSYVSLKIARRTGQWWLSDMSTVRKAKVAFDADEYAQFLETLAAYQDRIARSLQVSGQTGFNITYEDLSDEAVLAGLGIFLGAGGPPDPAKVRAKVQNPTPVAARLTNPQVAEDALKTIAHPDIGSIPNHEPGRGPGLRHFRACRTAPLLYMPVRGAGFDPVPAWLEGADPDGAVEAGMTQKDLRRWKRLHPGHRSFTVIRHPLPRVWDAFNRFLVAVGEEAYADLRHALVHRYGVPLPSNGSDTDFGTAAMRDTFLAFLKFLSGNLGGQTALRVDYSWASQTTLLHAIADFAVPDRVIREESLTEGLAGIAREAGVDARPEVTGFAVPAASSLAEIVTPEIEVACAAAYRRDYVMLGFGPWRPGDQAA